jgi:hypothetical protein
MFKSGKFLSEVMNYLDITNYIHRKKLDASYKHEEWSSFDERYAYIIERAHNWSEEYWLTQMHNIEPKQWQFLMRAKFGWSTAAPYKERRLLPIKLDANKPSTLLDTVISEVSEGNMSAEQGKSISELVIQSYHVKEIEPEATEQKEEKAVKEVK